MRISNEHIGVALQKQALGNVVSFLSMDFIEQAEDRFLFKCFFPEETKNPFGFVQGGMTAAALDDATAVTVCMQLEGLKVPNSTDIHITYHRPVPLGEALIEVKVLKLGKQIVSVEGKLYTSCKRLAATMLHTAILLEAPL
jgi:uncharacterized protein (TIGR00369 family)